MRALKLWMQLRYFGLDGLRRRIDAHCRLAEELAAAVDADPDFERLAPAPVLDGLPALAAGRAWPGARTSRRFGRASTPRTSG